MAASFASRIDRIEPPRVQLTSHGGARVRVVGSALGWVRCGRERRWVWGRFDQTFLVRDAKATLEVRVFGLGGGQRRRVPVERRIDLQPPRVRFRRPTLRVAPSTTATRVPRLRALTQADLGLPARGTARFDVLPAHGSARFDPLPEDPSHD